MKYLLVSGGVVSGLGKGVTASSIGVLLKSCGLRVTSIKIGALLAGWGGQGPVGGHLQDERGRQAGFEGADGGLPHPAGSGAARLTACLAACRPLPQYGCGHNVAI
jgi:hypothetical protein